MIIPPRTALGGAAMGANLDQQKMMGTPAQKASAAAPKPQPEPEVQPATIRTQKLTESLGEVGARVQDLVQTAVQGLQNAPAQVVNVEGLPPEQAELLQQISTNPSPELMAQLQQQLGTDVAGLEAFLSSRFTPDVAAQLKSMTSGGTGEPTLTTLLPPESLTELTSILGPEAATYTLPQLEQAISEMEAQEFAEVNQLAAQARNPNLTQADREAARARLRELGAAGMLTSQDAFQELIQKIDDAQTVQFGGQEWEVADILGDEGMSAVIQNYLEDPEFAKAVKQSDPDLAKFVDENKIALEGLSLETSPAAGALDEYKTELAQEQTTRDEIGFDEETFRQLMGEGPIRGSTFEKAWNDTPKSQRSAWAGFAQTVSSAKGLADLGDLIGGRDPTELMQEFLNYRRFHGEPAPGEAAFRSIFDQDRDGQVDEFETTKSSLMNSLRRDAATGDLTIPALRPPDMPAVFREIPAIADADLSLEELAEIDDLDQIEQLYNLSKDDKIRVPRRAQAELERKYQPIWKRKTEEAYDRGVEEIRESAGVDRALEHPPLEDMLTLVAEDPKALTNLRQGLASDVFHLQEAIAELKARGFTSVTRDAYYRQLKDWEDAIQEKRDLKAELERRTQPPRYDNVDDFAIPEMIPGEDRPLFPEEQEESRKKGSQYVGGDSSPFVWRS